VKHRKIYITESDMKRLRDLLEAAAGTLRRDSDNLRRLEEELDRAEIVRQEDLPSDAVTMNSRVLVEDIDCAVRTAYELVYPRNADISRGKISVLAPIGTALLGYREGDSIEWEVPAGKRRLKILRVEYQPEAAGEVA